MWHNFKTSESDPRGVLGHGGETYNDNPFGGSVRRCSTKGPGALESINGQLIQSRIRYVTKKERQCNNQCYIQATEETSAEIKLQRGDGA